MDEVVDVGVMGRDEFDVAPTIGGAPRPVDRGGTSDCGGWLLMLRVARSCVRDCGACTWDCGMYATGRSGWVQQ